MVILGAGASHDAIDPELSAELEEVDRPPLADQLVADRPRFNEAMCAHPRAKGVIGALRAAMRQHLSLEDQLADLQRTADTDFAPEKIELAALRFYIRDVVTRCSDSVESIGLTNHVGPRSDPRAVAARPE
jgi:hypothetical protein